MLTSESEHHWFAIKIRSRHERMTAECLRSKNLEVFLPLYQALRQWTDRKKELELPVFPGYLFCRFDPAKRLPVLISPGVVHIVGIGRQPVPIDDTEIEAIQILVRSGCAVAPCAYVATGTTVQMERGPLRGLHGIAVRHRNERRLVLSVKLLQRSVSVEINRDWVGPCNSAMRLVAPADGVRAQVLL